MARQIQGMIVVITGASSGIGWELARQLGGHGARLALAARRLHRLEELNHQLGGQHLIIRADVSQRADCEMIIARTIEHYGQIDTLVCNAGYGIARMIPEMSHEEMLQMFRTNVFGTTDCIRAAVPHMRQQEPRDGWRGQIMIVSSAMARRTVPFFGAYGATKAAQLSLAEALRVELRPFGIAVTSVHPVGTSTEFFAHVEQESGAKVRPATTAAMKQSPVAVAKSMIRGIRRPRPELWPMRISRWLLGLAALMPRATDRTMAWYRDRTTRLLRQNSPPSQGGAGTG